MSGALFDAAFVERIHRLGVVPLIVLDDAGHAAPLAKALVDGGLPCAEVALRTPASLAALERMAAASDELLVGAGTVLSAAQVDEAKAAGARFIVAPGLNERVVRRSQELGLPVVPGVATPTEIEAALELGLDVLKFFPAEPMGGLPFLKAVAAPYGQVRFMPTGGIDAGKLAGYLAFDRVAAVGGSWVAPKEWVARKEFSRVRDEVARAVATVATVRASGRTA